jgi:hypothetical protein
MKRLLTHMTLATALVLCFDCRSILLSPAAAEQGSAQKRPIQTRESPENATVSFGTWQTEPPFDRFPPIIPLIAPGTTTCCCQTKRSSGQVVRSTL